MPGPAFLTGGSGFVGGALLRRLTSDGREVRALARSSETVHAVEADGGLPIRGDVFDEDALLLGMRGCETVFHVAGVNAMCLRDAEPMLRTNVRGSASVVRAAARAGVARVVYTSSAATIGEPRGVIGTENTPHRGTFLSAYERSKFMAEQRVFALGADLGIDVVSVNPSSVQGPGRTEGSARLLIGLVNARWPVVVDTFLSILDVDDCTQGHVAAEELGRPGERYVLNGASVTTRRAVELVRAVAGRPRHVIRVPRAAAPLAGTTAGWAARLVRRDLPFCTELARTLLHGHRYDGSRATRELGLTYHRLEETVARTVGWYAEHGLVRSFGSTMIPPARTPDRQRRTR
ncbi:MAG: NAD-dependent epimerase/dehydratase family protein [Actinomycetota bacterium]